MRSLIPSTADPSILVVYMHKRKQFLISDNVFCMKKYFVILILLAIYPKKTWKGILSTFNLCIVRQTNKRNIMKES